MKRLATIGFIVVSLGVSGPVFAQENVGLLPTNPFYFLKEWGRSFRQVVTPRLIKKVELALQVREEKLAELKKMAVIAAAKVNGIVFIIDNYVDSVNRLNEVFEGITDGVAADKMLTSFVEQTVRHYMAIDGLRIRFDGDASLQSDLDNAQSVLIGSLAAIGQRLDTPEKFAARLRHELIQGSDPLKEIHGAELVERLAGELESEFKKVVLQLQEDTLLTLSGHLEGNMFLLGKTFSVSGLGSAVSDPLLRLMVLDELRELVTNTEIKNQLSILRQSVLERAETDGKLTEEKIETAIEAVSGVLKEVEVVMKDATTSLMAQQLMNSAIFHIEQADQLVSEGNNAGAFGQVMAANAALKSAFLYSQWTVEDSIAAGAALRVYYDELVKKIGGLNPSKEKAAKIAELLNQAEKDIVETSRLIGNNASRDRIIPVIRSIKTGLATIETLSA